MGRRIDIELTSTRADGTWTWRAAGAREPKGTVESGLLPAEVQVGDVVRAELEGFIDGMRVTSVLPPKTSRKEPKRLELIGSPSDEPLVTSTRSGGDRRRDRRDRRTRRPRDGRRDGGREQDRHRNGQRRGRPERSSDGRDDRDGPRRSKPPEDARPKPKRLRPGRTHRNALLESLKTEERPVAEQVLQGGIPAVRQAIQKQNETLRAEGKPEVNADALLQMAERLRPQALAATWRDRADAALKNVDDLDLRDLRSVVNAAGDAGRDSEAREVADKLREALARRVEAEQATWVKDVADNLQEERVVRALRLSSRPPKAGSPLPGDLTQQLIDATAAALTSETAPQRWATVLDALAYSPIRRRVVPDSLPPKLTPELRETIARLATRLPEIAHIFDIAPEEAPARQRSSKRRTRKSTKGTTAEGSGRKGDDGTSGSGDKEAGRRTAGEGSGSTEGGEASSSAVREEPDGTSDDRGDEEGQGSLAETEAAASR